MPPWLTLILVLVGLVLWVGIEAALTMGSARVFKVAVKQFGAWWLGLAALCAVVFGFMYLVG